MPNHVYQKIRICDWNYTDAFKEAKKKVLNDKNEFDFNLLIPQPKNIFNGNLGEKERQMCKEEGRPVWYDWNRENWGTKWNAYGTEILENDDDTLEIKFQTAWNIPKPIIDKIFEVFKDFSIKYIAVDEGYYFAVDITKDEEGEIKETDLKEHCDTLMFAMR